MALPAWAGGVIVIFVKEFFAWLKSRKKPKQENKNNEKT